MTIASNTLSIGLALSPRRIHATLMKPESWFEADTGRLEMINRVRHWRYILGDQHYGVDWLTRVEHEFH